MFLRSLAASLLKVFWPLLTFQRANRFQMPTLGSREQHNMCLPLFRCMLSLRATAALCENCCFLLLLSICVDLSTCLSCAYRLIVSPPCSPPPPGSEDSLGNSLNTSEEELHTAGITLAPKGTRTSHRPISIQIAPAQALITITGALIAISATPTSYI